MIYTVTLNPSLDYIVTVNDFRVGKTNRTETERMIPGGKGLSALMVDLHKDDILVLAGNIPQGVSKSIYKDILVKVSEKDVMCVVDTTGELLLNVLECHLFLVKPNQHELEEIFGVELTDTEAVVAYAEQLRKMGAANVLVSLAGQGAVLAAENGKVYVQKAPKGKLINAVGAGDSMVAGFLTGWLQEVEQTSASDFDRYLRALRMGVAAGSASAFSEDFAVKESIYRLYDYQN